MQRTKCQYRRLLEVLDLIRKGREPQDHLPELSTVRRRSTLANCRTIAKKLEVSEKTVQRDISFLIDQIGAPIAYDDQRHGYYLTEASYQLPGGLVTAEDVYQLAIAERILEAHGYPSLARTIGTMVERTPSAAAASLGDLRDRVLKGLEVRDELGPELSPEVWEGLAKGLLRNQRVLVTLKQCQGQPPLAYRLDPYRLVKTGGRWTVAGLAHRKDAAPAYRTEALANIESTALVGTIFCREPLRPPDVPAATGPTGHQDEPPPDISVAA
ncbi:MAG: HTH domain-containing protein [Lentisphaerae bacterium]|nr:HTH domain-containing protein [Lentisphaerota bacterium]